MYVVFPQNFILTHHKLVSIFSIKFLSYSVAVSGAARVWTEKGGGSPSYFDNQS